MIQVKCVSGDPEYVEGQLATLLSNGWEILDIETNIYHDSGGLRTVTTAYLKKSILYLDQGSVYSRRGHKYWGKCKNSNSISIEMCSTGGKHSKNILTNAYELGRRLANKYDIDDDHIIRHFDVNGKLCPLYFVTNEEKWLDFKKDMGKKNHGSLRSKIVLPTRGYFQYGDNGWKVKNLQIWLNLQGYDCGRVDGKYGVKTIKAVKHFEQEYGLSVDGEFGRKCYVVYRHESMGGSVRVEI